MIEARLKKLHWQKVRGLWRCGTVPPFSAPMAAGSSNATLAVIIVPK